MVSSNSPRSKLVAVELLFVSSYTSFAKNDFMTIKFQKVLDLATESIVNCAVCCEITKSVATSYQLFHVLILSTLTFLFSTKYFNIVFLDLR